MGNIESFILSLAVFFPLVLCLLRYKSLEEGYNAFQWLIFLAALTEIASHLSIRYFKTNAVVTNIYSLAECIILLYQFYYWRKNKLVRKLITIVAIVCSVIWIAENIIAGYINVFRPAFRISYAFFLVLLSINEINYLITHENRRLLTNARFILCLGFLIFFLYQILLEASFFISTRESHTVSNKIIELSVYINLLVNILYGIAILLIPKKSIFNFKKGKERD